MSPGVHSSASSAIESCRAICRVAREVLENILRGIADVQKEMSETPPIHALTMLLGKYSLDMSRCWLEASFG